jgi:hypothetical protein
MRSDNEIDRGRSVDDRVDGSRLAGERGVGVVMCSRYIVFKGGGGVTGFLRDMDRTDEM